eukprot:4938808-Ditylum_brightwellii.AAC.1
MCKEHFLVVKEHAIEEDGEVRVSLCCVMPVSAQENTCKDNNLGGKERAIEEEGEVGASSLLSKKPVSAEENTCKQDCL